MAELKRYLYNGLRFKINTGVKPILVNDQVVESKQGIPSTLWTLEFGKVDLNIKDAIEQVVFLEPNNTFIKSPVGPAYYIGKRVDYVTNAVSYFISYIFEYKYHNTFVNKPLSYIVDGTDHLIEGSIRIPANQSPSDPAVQIKGNNYLPRKLKHLSTDMVIVHETYRLFNLSIDFVESAAPLPFSDVYIVGESYASADYIC